MLPPPGQDVVAAIDGLLSAGNHEQIVATCEIAMVDRLFWLDPHRHVANALGALGQDSARAAVIAEVAAFLARFPRIADLKFQGGIPFADDQTRVWLSETVLKSEQGSVDQGGGADDGGAGAALAVARGMVANGKQDEAVQILTDGARAAPGGRARLHWDLAKAELCLAMGMPNAAYSMLTALDERHSSFDLEGWEPSLAERLCVLRFQSVKRGGADDILAKERVQQVSSDLIARLYRLNMVTALVIMRS